MTAKQTKEQSWMLGTAFETYNKALNTHAFFKVHNQVVGEDLVQDTFVKTWKYLVHGGEILAMKSFLYHVLNNLIVDEYRKKQVDSLDTLLENGFEPEAEETKEKLTDVLDGQVALGLIPQLPEAYQKIMQLRYVQGLSIKEISLITGERSNTIAVRLHRGLAKLRLLYQPITKSISKNY